VLSGQEDDDQAFEEFRLAWRGRRLRALQTPLAVALADLVGLPDSEAVGISAVPFGFEEPIVLPAPRTVSHLCGRDRTRVATGDLYSRAVQRA
jgi:hypothetical protein